MGCVCLCARMSMSLQQIAEYFFLTSVLWILPPEPESLQNSKHWMQQQTLNEMRRNNSQTGNVIIPMQFIPLHDEYFDSIS